MALTDLQRRVCHIVATRLRESGEGYVAGGLALSEVLATRRISRDLDLFHDTAEALVASVARDRKAFAEAGLRVEMTREFPGLVEDVVRDDAGETVRVEWVRDSAFRFFPLVTHPELGLTLHPLDLATNKVCALVGRVEVRDWVDTIACHTALQPMGYLAWAASGKDAGLSPTWILEQAARTARYSRDEVATLAFDGDPPELATLSQVWRSALAEGHEIIRALPPEHVGTCVLGPAGEAFRGAAAALRTALAGGDLVFHRGHVGGTVPVVRAGS